MRALRHLPFMLLAFCSAQAARAGSAIVIWPVDPVIAAGQRSTALWIENRGREPVTLQVRTFGWSQAGGDNDYPRQDRIMMSPPIADVAPGQRQLVRLIRREATPSAGEGAFRLLIDELPRPVDPGTAGAVSATLSVQIRYSIPLFTYGAKAEGAPALSARTVLIEGKRYAEIRNDGSRHARLTDLRLASHGRTVDIAPGLAGYVLAGATMRWALPADAPPDGAITAGVNGADQALASAT